MRYLTDLGVKLDEVVVLAVLTELGAPTMGEFTRDGFLSGWQNHRYAFIPMIEPYMLTQPLITLAI